MADAGSITAWLKLNTDGFVSGMDKAKIGLVQWRDQTNESSRDMLKWGAAITATIAPLLLLGREVIQATEKYGAMADTITDLALVTGLSTEKIQKLQYASILAGQDFGTTSIAATKLTLSISGFSDSSSAAHKAFDRLGVNPAGKSREQVFDEVARAIYNVKDETERASVASELYGKSWKDMIPFIETYVEKADEIKEAPIFSDKELQNLKEANVEWQKLSTNVTIYSGKALAFLDDINNKYNESQKSMQTGSPIYQKYYEIFGYRDGSKPGSSSSGAGGRGGSVTPASSSSTSAMSDNSWAYALFGGESAGKSDNAVDKIENLTKAMKTYKDALKDVATETKELADLNRDYYGDVEYAGRDMSQIRSLTRNWDKSTAKQKESVASAQGKAGEAAAAVGKAGGDLVLYINGNQAPVTVPGIIGNTSGISAADLMAKGIRKVA